jgi:hypothetical protein
MDNQAAHRGHLRAGEKCDEGFGEVGGAVKRDQRVQLNPGLPNLPASMG